MRDTDLPYPGVINTGQQLRREVARSLSGIQTSVNPATGKHAEAAKLQEFFQAAADFLEDYKVD